MTGPGRAVPFVLSAMLLLAGTASARAEARSMTLSWDPIAFAYGYRLEIKDARGNLVVNRVIRTNRLSVKLTPGEYQHRLTVLNKFRKPASSSRWKRFAARGNRIRLNDSPQPRKSPTKKHPRKTGASGWTRWIPGAGEMAAGRTSPRLAALGGLTALGVFALVHAEQTRTANANDPLQRFFREPALYLSIRDAVNLESIALLSLSARDDLTKTRRLLRRDERVFYASLSGLGILYFFHFRGPDFRPESRPDTRTKLTFMILPGRSRAAFAWRLTF